jgi:hypothetical protein
VRAFLKPLLILFLCPVSLLTQSNSGELRLKVTGPDGLGVKSPVELSSDVTQFHRNYATDASGGLAARNIPFGIYHIQVEHKGFRNLSWADGSPLRSLYRSHSLRFETTF